MIDKTITLDSWMKENRWTNTALAESLTTSGHCVSHSQISEIRNKRCQPSAKLALAIFEFFDKKIPLECIFNKEIVKRDSAEEKVNTTETKG